MGPGPPTQAGRWPGNSVVGWLGSRGTLRLEPGEELATDNWFDRNWAQSLVNAALARLRAECAAEGLEQRFEVLRQFLGGEPGGVSYATAAGRLGLSESAVKSAIHRLR